MISRNSHKTILPPGFSEDDYTPVDMLYNISRREGQESRGFDGIHRKTGERHYFTHGSCETSEQIIRHNLGQVAVLELIAKTEDVAAYRVPDGAQLLTKTLETAPFSSAYMEKLAMAGREFIESLRRLDSNGFGVELGHIAIAQNGHDEHDHRADDDTYLTIIPPIGPALTQQS